MDPHADLIVSQKSVYGRYLNVGTDESVGPPLSFVREAATARHTNLQVSAASSTTRPPRGARAFGGACQCQARV
ncbi:hypothetical protein ANTPLA_LOCUS7205 [Anthophora plagiata]